MGAYDHIRVDRFFNVNRSSSMVLNRRTLALYRHAVVVYHTIGGTGQPYLIQGSYHPGNDASGGTHDGGGAGDTGLTVPTAKNWHLWEKALRMCMFADWDRPTLPGEWEHHNHGAPLWDRDASGALKSQYSDFLSGRNGMKGHALDDASHYRPPVIFTPVYPLKNVNLTNVAAEARAAHHQKLPGVVYIQRALNKKLGTDLVADGIFGPRTKKIYARWERSIGGNGDGIPGMYSLILLGAGRFNVHK